MFNFDSLHADERHACSAAEGSLSWCARRLSSIFVIILLAVSANVSLSICMHYRCLHQLLQLLSPGCRWDGRKSAADCGDGHIAAQRCAHVISV